MCTIRNHLQRRRFCILSSELPSRSLTARALVRCSVSTEFRPMKLLRRFLTTRQKRPLQSLLGIRGEDWKSGEERFHGGIAIPPRWEVFLSKFASTWNANYLHEMKPKLSRPITKQGVHWRIFPRNWRHEYHGYDEDLQHLHNYRKPKWLRKSCRRPLCTDNAWSRLFGGTPHSSTSWELNMPSLK
jgi:hypothetical protein